MLLDARSRKRGEHSLRDNSPPLSILVPHILRNLGGAQKNV
jgi:hypothetical protein